VLRLPLCRSTARLSLAWYATSFSGQPDPGKACEMLTKFLKPQHSAQEIDAAIANSRFAHMPQI
jgi:hypothetical protein